MQLIEPVPQAQIREFRGNLRRLERLIALQLKGSGCCRGVTLAQCHALLEIEARESVALNELALGLNLDNSTMSRTVHGLVAAGLVKRTTGKPDRRYTLLSLSPMGKNICGHINAENDRLFARVFERIAAADRPQAFSAFLQIVDALSAEMQLATLNSPRGAAKPERMVKPNETRPADAARK